MDREKVAFFREVGEPVRDSRPVSYEVMKDKSSVRNSYSDAFWKTVYFVPGIVVVGLSKMFGLDKLLD